MKNKKRKREYYFGRQCQFQIMGRRCQLLNDECSGMHQLLSKYCEFHNREEYIHECDDLADINSD